MKPFSFHRNLVLLVGVLLSAVLSGCDTDPSPSYSEAGKIKSTRIAVTPMGEPFELDGCKVQAHRATVSGSLPNFTLVTASCPTAQVTATTQSCGKNCTSEALKVERAVPVDETAAKTRELRAKMDALNQELQALEGQLKR